MFSRSAFCLTTYLALAVANSCYAAGGTWTTKETHWFDYDKKIVRYERVVTTTPYQHEISSLVDKTMSAPIYDSNAEEMERRYWPASVSGTPKETDFIRIESNYRWANEGELTRSVRDNITKKTVSQTLSAIGYLIEESLDSDRGRITIRYEWKDGRCLGAVAQQGDRVIARANAVAMGQEPSGLYFQEVREQYFGTSRDSAPQYEAISKYAISYRAEKIDERAIAGTKQGGIFQHWGTEEVSMVWENTGKEGLAQASRKDRKGNVLVVRFRNNRDVTASKAIATVNDSVVATTEAEYRLSR